MGDGKDHCSLKQNMCFRFPVSGENPVDVPGLTPLAPAITFPWVKLIKKEFCHGRVILTVTHSHTFNFCAIFFQLTYVALHLMALYGIAIQRFRFISSIRNDGWKNS